MHHRPFEPAHAARIRSDGNIGMKRDPRAEEYRRKAAQHYTRESSAMVYVVAGDVGTRFNRRNRRDGHGARITLVASGEGVD